MSYYNCLHDCEFKGNCDKCKKTLVKEYNQMIADKIIDCKGY